MKQCDSLPDPSSTQEHQKCLWSSCETQAGVSGQTEGQNSLISVFCYRLRMKAIHLLITNNNYIFSGAGIWNKILKPHVFLCRSGWGFWATRHIQTYFSYSLPKLPGIFSHLYNTTDATARKPPLPSARDAPDTAVHHNNVMMPAHGKENDCSPRNDTK